MPILINAYSTLRTPPEPNFAHQLNGGARGALQNCRSTFKASPAMSRPGAAR